MIINAVMSNSPGFAMGPNDYGHDPRHRAHGAAYAGGGTMWDKDKDGVLWKAKEQLFEFTKAYSTVAGSKLNCLKKIQTLARPNQTKLRPGLC